MDNNKEYVNFEAWFNELENYSLRSERFFSQLEAIKEQELRQRFVMCWMKVAWEQGRRSMLWQNA